MEPLLLSLKDIHLPVVQGAAAASSYVLWPFFLFAALCAAVGWLVWRRKTHWRRQVNAELLQIEQQQHHDPAAAWQGLALLLRRVAIQAGELPNDSINPSASVARFTGEAWLQRLDSLFNCNTFSAGAGRGLIDIPYRRHSSREEVSETKQEEFLATQRLSSANLSQLITVIRGGLRAIPDL